MADTRTRNRTKRPTCRFEALEQRRLLSGGVLDTSFGDAGSIARNLGFTPSAFEMMHDGRLVYVGSANGNFAVARVNPDGALDRSFAGNGITTTDFGRTDAATAVAIDANGRIVVAGYSGSTNSALTSSFAVARYNANGTLDRTFDSDGKVKINFGTASSDRAYALAIQNDGKILLGGEAANLINLPPLIDYDFALARLNPDGSLDRTFGTPINPTNQTLRNGKVKLGFGRDEAISSLLIQEDGKIVTGGTRTRISNDNAEFALARFNANGSLDRSFATRGKTLTSFVQDVHLRSLAFQGQKIVAAGQSTFGREIALARYNPNGVLDTTFGSGVGRVVTPMGSLFNSARKVLVTPDEKLLVAGSASGDILLMRYHFSGALDTSFGQNGKVITDLGAQERVVGATYDNLGRLMVAGSSGDDAMAARYFETVPTVQVVTLRHGTENGDNGRFIFYRNKRLDYPTVVNFDIGGTATRGADYTGLGNFSRGSIIIPAGETFAVRDVRVIDDVRMEPTETVIVSLAHNGFYDIGAKRRAIMYIYDNDTLRINFQPDGTAVPAGFRADTGRVFANRGNGYTYGWDEDNSDQTRDRDILTDQRIDTLTHLQKDGADRRWELAVPNGAYSVRIVSSDPAFQDGHWKIDVEGVLAIDHAPTPDAFFAEKRVTVHVTDGRLTIGNAAGAINNKLAFVEVRSAEFVSPPPPQRPIAGGSQVLAPLGSGASTSDPSTSSPFSTTPIRLLVLP